MKNAALLKEFFGQRGLSNEQLALTAQASGWVFIVFGTLGLGLGVVNSLSQGVPNHVWIQAAVWLLGLLFFGGVIPASPRQKLTALSLISVALTLGAIHRYEGFIHAGAGFLVSAVVCFNLAFGTRTALAILVAAVTAAAAIAIERGVYSVTYVMTASVAVSAICLFTSVFVSFVLRSISRMLEEQQELNRRLEASNEQLAERAELQDMMLTRLQQASEAQRKMFAIIGHELRTPAAAIKMLADDVESPIQTRSELSSTAEHLLQVIDDLRQATRADEAIFVESNPFLPSVVLVEAQRQITPLITGSGMALHLKCSLENDSVKYLSDAFRIRSILTNLIRNAVYHSGGSKIFLDVTNRALDERQHRIIFKVEDDGKGIPVDQIPRLFEAFERGDTSSGGTGVGLYLVKSWAQALGGSVRYEASETGGARFLLELDLPVVLEEPSRIFGAAKPKTHAAMLKGVQVLLVEDDKLLRKTQEKVLTRVFGADVTVATDGVQGLRLAMEQRFDLVITDFFMPHMDGKEMIRELRAAQFKMPIIGLTAATIGDEQNELVAAGADAVLSKPLEIEALTDVLNGLVADAKLTLAGAGPDAAGDLGECN